MRTTLTWTASVSASCFHAVSAKLAGATLVDAELERALTPAVEELTGWLEFHSVPLDRTLMHLAPLAGGIENNLQLAEVTLRKTIGPCPRDRAESLSRIVASLERATLEAVPNLLDRVAAAGKSLRDRWKVEGLATLNAIEDMAEEALLVPKATVLLVHPSLGGAAVPHLPYNSLRIEALAPGDEPLPETLRLAWALAQLNLDLPHYSERLKNAERVVRLALIPLVLAAAERREALTLDVRTLRLALDGWAPEDRREEIGDILLRWWNVYTTSDMPWPLAVVALERMLENVPAEGAPLETPTDSGRRGIQHPAPAAGGFVEGGHVSRL